MIGIVQNLIIATTYFVTDCALDFTFKFLKKKHHYQLDTPNDLACPNFLIFRLFSLHFLPTVP